MFLFLFTRPSDYRNLARDIKGTQEDQWCAWVEGVGYECNGWRHARRIIDEATQLGKDIGSKIPVTAPSRTPPAGRTEARQAALSWAGLVRIFLKASRRSR